MAPVLLLLCFSCASARAEPVEANTDRSERLLERDAGVQALHLHFGAGMDSDSINFWKSSACVERGFHLGGYSNFLLSGN